MNPTIHNLHDEATVTLTAAGAHALNTHYAPFRKEFPDQAWPTGVEGCAYSTELWHLMQIFGATMHAGGANPFVNNRIILKGRA